MFERPVKTKRKKFMVQKEKPATGAVDVMVKLGRTLLESYLVLPASLSLRLFEVLVGFYFFQS